MAVFVTPLGVAPLEFYQNLQQEIKISVLSYDVVFAIPCSAVLVELF